MSAIKTWKSQRLGPLLQVMAVCNDGQEREVLFVRRRAEALAAIRWLQEQAEAARQQERGRVLLEARDAVHVGRREVANQAA